MLGGGVENGVGLEGLELGYIEREREIQGKRLGGNFVTLKPTAGAAVI